MRRIRIGVITIVIVDILVPVEAAPERARVRSRGTHTRPLDRAMVVLVTYHMVRDGAIRRN